VLLQNTEIANLFDEMADILEIKGQNPFRVRAYRNAARSLRDVGRDVETMVKKGEDLTRIPGIGEDLAGKIGEVVKTGTFSSLKSFRKRVPRGLVELLRIPALGPKRVELLHHRLGITTVAGLARACRAKKVREIRGLGAKTEEKILEHLASREKVPKRFKLSDAIGFADAIVSELGKVPGVSAVAAAGSLRRCRETVGDVDILATASSAGPVMEAFRRGEGVRRVLSGGPTRSTIVLRSGLQVDLRVLDPESYGAALVYFTGSKAHNIALRHRAMQRRLKINEYGVFRGKRLVAGKTEASVYASVGLPWIPPELRENAGEIEAGEKGKLPRLVELADLRGDLQAHTRATDGRNTLVEMAEAARRRGFEYLAITDHSRRLAMTRGLDPRRLRAQIREIERFNAKRSGITLLTGIEVDILEDGRLDLPDDVLGEVDVVVGAVHSHFGLPRRRQTERILRAMDHPFFTILAHPSGRLIGERDPCDVDIGRVLRRAKERGCVVEVDAQPDRLDLLDSQCRMAKELGVRIAIDSDAHSVLELQNLRFGVGQARRGWLEKGDVVNTRPLAELRKILRATRLR